MTWIPPRMTADTDVLRDDMLTACEFYMKTVMLYGSRGRIRAPGFVTFGLVNLPPKLLLFSQQEN